MAQDCKKGRLEFNPIQRFERNLAAILEARMDAEQYTYEGLADALRKRYASEGFKISRSTVHRHMIGETAIPPRMVLRYCEVFDLSYAVVNTFATITTDERRERLQCVLREEDIDELLLLFTAIQGTEKRRKLIEMARDLVKYDNVEAPAD